MKPKSNKAGKIDKPMGYDCCQTPAYALEPLVQFIPLSYVIWEPAAGKGLMADALRAYGYSVIATDIQDGYNFFEYQPEHYDCIITNPPYSIKYKWLARCYQLGKPFALLIPVESIGAKAAQIYYREYGLNCIFLDKRVDFIMPMKGAESSAQFPVFWSCRNLVTYPGIAWGKLNKPSKGQA